MTAVVPLGLSESLEEKEPRDVPQERSAVGIATHVGEQVFAVISGGHNTHQAREYLSSALANKLLGPPPSVGQAQRPDQPLWKVLGPGYRMWSMHACPVTDSAVEACMIIGTRRRARALVLRFEHDEQHWVCTLLCPV